MQIARVQIAQVLAARTDPHCEVARIERLIAVRHMEADGHGVSISANGFQLRCTFLKMVEATLHAGHPN